MRFTYLNRIILAFSAFLTFGCSSTIFEPFDITESVSVDAKQRLFLSGHRSGDSYRTVVCAEPSPDALVAIATSGSLEANVIGSGSGAAAFASSEAAASIGLRTATIQLLRDALYRACEAYMNDAIDEVGYSLILGKIDDVMIKLLAIEGLTRIPAAKQVVLQPGAQTTADAPIPVNRSNDSENVADASGGSPESTTNPTTGNAGGKGESAVSCAASESCSGDQAQSVASITESIRKMSDQSKAASTLAGACFVWMARTKNLSSVNFQHKTMLAFCDKVLKQLDKHETTVM